jgi:hypothetical protein
MLKNIIALIGAFTITTTAALAAPLKAELTKDATGAPCAFGQNYGPISSGKHPLFKSKKIGVTLKLDPTDKEHRVLLVQVVELTHKKTKKVYHMNYTNDDAWDGGNTLGWIEEMVYEQVDKIPVAATISDTDIYCGNDFN